MTATISAEQTQTHPKIAPRGWFYVCSRVKLGVPLAATAALYLWNLAANGWANAFYSAAA